MCIEALKRRSHGDIARLLAGITIIVYLIVFAVIFMMGTKNGVTAEHMLALDRGETVDVTEYVHLAKNMLAGKGFLISDHVGPEFLRTPGYPLFLAALLLVHAPLIIVPLVQLIFTAGTVALIYLIGVRHFPRTVALAAAVIYMIDPVVMYVTWTPIAEPLFMFFFLGSIYAMGSFSRRAWLPFIVAGILFAIAIYMRPVGLYLAPIVAALAIAYSHSWTLAAKRALLFLAVVFCLLMPWMLRNYALAGHFNFSSGGAYNLYFVNVSTFQQALTGENYQDIHRRYNEKYFGTQEEDMLRSFKYADQQKAIAYEVLLAHPVKYAIFHTLKSMQLFVGSSIVNVKYHMYQFGMLPGEKPQGEGAWGMILTGRYSDAAAQILTHIPRTTERVLWLMLYIGMLGTVAISIYRRAKRLSWIICAFLLVHAVAFMTGPSSDATRYRLPLEPFLLLLGLFAVYNAVAFLRQSLFQTKK